jgi:hypothetical protein
MLIESATALVQGPGSLDLGENSLSEDVPGSSQGEGDMRVEALQAAPPCRAPDPELERGAGVAGRSPTRQLPPYSALLLRALLEALGQLDFTFCGPAPALDSARRFEPRNGGHEMGAGQPVGRREWPAGVVVRLLLGDRRPAERTAGA